MDTGLQGKTVLITGAANGIGRATALAFAREGAHLALIDRDAQQLEKTAHEAAAHGVSVSSVVADFSSAAGCSSGLDELLGKLPDGLDVLFNNIGQADPRPFMEITDEQWERSFQVTLMSAVRVTRHLLPVLRRKEKAAIVMNASDLARQPEPAPADYGAMKAAMLSVTKSLARSEAPRIRVNAVAPGTHLEHLLVASRRLCGRLGGHPQPAAAAGGRPRDEAATTPAAASGRARRGCERRCLPRQRPGLLHHVLRVGCGWRQHPQPDLSQGPKRNPAPQESRRGAFYVSWSTFSLPCAACPRR